jgi:hypothetical protein
MLVHWSEGVGARALCAVGPRIEENKGKRGNEKSARLRPGRSC